MSVWILNILTKLRSSLWLIPSCMVLLAFLLSLIVPFLDEWFSLHDPEANSAIRWLGNIGPQGAMTLLSTIAGSMITIAGVVFSITIVVLTLASSQFGPRLLGNFLRDRANQIVLGTFIATFLYCLLVLRTIQLNPEGYTPYWGTLIGLLLAICSLGVLIYFIHHIAISIQAPHLIARVSSELTKDIERLFPEKIGQGDQNNDKDNLGKNLVEWIETEGVNFLAEGNGYLQAVDGEKLMTLARKENLYICLYYRPGHFLNIGLPMGKVMTDKTLTPSLMEQIHQQFIFGDQRTQEQDVEFSVLQLVEVAVRALSPGTNDPFTCNQCIDFLSANLCLLSKREFPAPYRYDVDKRLRIIAPVVTFEGVVNAAFHQIRQHAKGNVAVLIRLLEGLRRIGACVEWSADKMVVKRHVAMLQRESQDSVSEPRDLEKIERCCRQVLELVSISGKESL